MKVKEIAASEYVAIHLKTITMFRVIMIVHVINRVCEIDETEKKALFLPKAAAFTAKKVAKTTTQWNSIIVFSKGSFTSKRPHIGCGLYRLLIRKSNKAWSATWTRIKCRNRSTKRSNRRELWCQMLSGLWHELVKEYCSYFQPPALRLPIEKNYDVQRRRTVTAFSMFTWWSPSNFSLGNFVPSVTFKAKGQVQI